MSDYVILSREKYTAIITLNRPGKLNAWDTPIRQEIITVLVSELAGLL
ncbi:MAG: enoyl-CoA hydratase/carnithine racemase [Parasphingorhabdus sp.]|jgi:enoyl-CoA hydratase/carnithine racemase